MILQRDLPSRPEGSTRDDRCPLYRPHPVPVRSARRGQPRSASFVYVVHVHPGPDGRRGRRRVRRRVRATFSGAGELPQRVPAPGLRHPGRAPSTSPCRSCVRAATSPNWLLEPRKRAEKALTSATPKASWPWVKTLLHSVYDQPDAASVHAQYDRLVDAVAGKLPRKSPVPPGRGPGPTCWPSPASRKRPGAGPGVEQPPGAAEPARSAGGPTWSGSSPAVTLTDPPRRRSPGRAARRMDRRPPLPRPRGPGPLPRHPRHRTPAATLPPGSRRPRPSDLQALSA